jgi:protein gp37
MKYPKTFWKKFSVFYHAVKGCLRKLKITNAALCEKKIINFRQSSSKNKMLITGAIAWSSDKLNLKGINWAIVAGESGPAACLLESTCARRQPLARHRARDGQRHQGKARR